MFKTYCGDCGNSWYIGNPRTCTCPWKDALKPKWVGLTEEDKLAIEIEAAENDFTDLGVILATEAALRRKNDR